MGGAARPWTTNERSQLVRMWNAGMTAPAISKQFGRSERAISMYVTKHRKELGLAKHADPVLPGQRAAIELELELFIERAMARTGRKRSYVLDVMLRYGMGENRRKRMRKFAAKVTDIGGMNDRAKGQGEAA